MGWGFALFVYWGLCVKRVTAAKVIFLIEGNGQRYKTTEKAHTDHAENGLQTGRA
ncbi:hypothetical protein AA18889_2376 [Acetobacter senegalensis DSM 18889]|nr:hypothetical protein AA18889_2376 [Acetobacter senegalensis DSM 18889]